MRGRFSRGDIVLAVASQEVRPPRMRPTRVSVLLAMFASAALLALAAAAPSPQEFNKYLDDIAHADSAQRDSVIQ